MSKFLIESPHTEAECLQALDGVLSIGTVALATYEWGCGDGVHAGYAIVEAANDDAARANVPDFLRAKATVVGLNKFTPDQIRSFHTGI